MKKLLLTFAICFASISSAWSQCVPSCSAYVVAPITYSLYTGLGGPNGFGTNVSLSDDAVSGSLPIGFTFNFYCNNYTNFQISSNGYITFDIATFANGCCSGIAIPNTSQPNDYIALGWNDWYPPGATSSGGFVSYATTGIAPNRRCIITYSLVPHCCTNGPPDNTGQIVLFETTNEIEIHSANITTDGSTCTQGIENSNGTLGLSVPGRNGVTWTTTNTAYRFFAGGAPTAVTAITGASNVCQGTVNSFTATTMPGVLSYVWTLPQGWSGTSTTSVMQATAGASGVVSVQATYSCGTSSPISFSVNTISSPSITSLAVSPNIICSGETVTITGSSNTGVTHTLMPDGISGTPPFTVMPSASTSYYLLAQNSNNCISFNSPMINVYVKQTPTITMVSGSVCLGNSFNLNPQGATNYTISSLFSIVTPPTAGVHQYTAVGTNSTGCLSDVVGATVTAIPLPVVSVSATKPSICLKESTTITATGATTYSWSNSITTESIIVTPLSPTIYSVTGTTGGCFKTVGIVIDVQSCTGIEKNGSQNAAVVVFPNPSSGEFSLSTPFAVHAVVYDMLGKVVYEKQLGEGTHKINLSQFAAGKYLLKTSSADHKQSTVLIKQ